MIISYLIFISSAFNLSLCERHSLLRDVACCGARRVSHFTSGLVPYNLLNLHSLEPKWTAKVPCESMFTVAMLMRTSDDYMMP